MAKIRNKPFALSAPLCLDSSYAPRILTGRRQHHPQGRIEKKFMAHHRILAVIDGVVHLTNKDQTLRRVHGEVAFLPAREAIKVQEMPGSRTLWIHFACFHHTTVHEQKSLADATSHHQKGRMKWRLEHQVAAPHPGAVQTWGVELRADLAPVDHRYLHDQLVRMGEYWWGALAQRIESEALLHLLLARWVALSMPPSDVPVPHSHDPIERAEVHAHRHLARGANVDSMAKESGVGQRRFQDLFRERHGMGPGAYLDGLRIDHAKTILRTSTLPLKEVARRSGWRSESTMIHRFRQIVGITPARFRKAAPPR